jgi:hypothetical protein
MFIYRYCSPQSYAIKEDAYCKAFKLIQQEKSVIMGFWVDKYKVEYLMVFEKK